MFNTKLKKNTDNFPQDFNNLRNKIFYTNSFKYRHNKITLVSSLSFTEFLPISPVGKCSAAHRETTEPEPSSDILSCPQTSTNSFAVLPLFQSVHKPMGPPQLYCYLSSLCCIIMKIFQL